ncbi:MAG: VPLPA-CTERM sorting domain-containing protein [Aliishimia sp.]
MFGKSLATAVFVSTVLGVSASNASSVDVTYQVSGTSFGNEGLRERVTISTPNDPTFAEGGLYDGSTSAGEFQLQGGQTLGEFAAFCVELAQSLQSAASYEFAPDLFGGRILANVDRLFSSAYSQIDTSIEAAAFQVALWEIVHDDASSFDLSAGNVLISGNDDVVDQASVYLSGLDTAATGLFDISFLQSDSSQDLVIATLRTESIEGPPPVPLPASSLLLLGGIGGLVAMRRKRSRR